jgi:5-methylcytosine-specific restriction endonuclease McrA
VPAERRICRPCRAPDRPVRAWYVNCAICGKLFVGQAYNATLCSDECRFVQHHGRPRLRDLRGCGGCGGPLPDDLRRQKCDGCVRETQRRAVSTGNRRRRARRRGAVRELYTLEYVANRDRFRCGICRRKVSMNLRYPHLRSATIDHVVPLAEGGADTRANVQLAHLICNSLKSDRGASQQLALIG